MWKKIILVTLALCLLASCNSKTPSSSEVNESELENIQSQEYVFDIFSVFELSKEEIFKKIGTDYEVVLAGAEGSYDGFLYSDLGVSFVFNPYDYIEFIECDERFSFNGARSGMTFAEIQEILGDKDIEESWFESSDNKVYKLKYIIDGLVFDFLAYEVDSSETYLTIYKVREN